MEEKQDRGQKRGRVLDRLTQQRERRVAKDTAHRDMLVREGIIRLVPPFEETVVIDTVRLRKINGRADWKWRATGLIPPRWGVAEMYEACPRWK